ncbi:MAG: type II toxin-antitoxin system VapC family toxin [Dehalococcoidia bacterium]
MTILLDVNVLVYAHREDAVFHAAAKEWLEHLLASDESYAISSGVLSSVLRIVTNRKMHAEPSTLEEALAFCSDATGGVGYVDLNPGPRHWDIFVRLCRAADARGDRIPDAYLAALAIEHGCELATFDRGFGRYPGLRWSVPRIPSGD